MPIFSSLAKYISSIGRRYVVDDGAQRTFHFTYWGALNAQKKCNGQIESLLDGEVIGEYDDDGAFLGK